MEENEKTVSAKATYTLSEAGRKAAILAGLPGEKYQTVTGEISATDLPLAEIRVGESGAVYLEMKYVAEFDVVQTPASLVDFIKQKKQEKEREAKAKEEEQARFEELALEFINAHAALQYLYEHTNYVEIAFVVPGVEQLAHAERARLYKSSAAAQELLRRHEAKLLAVQRGEEERQRAEEERKRAEEEKKRAEAELVEAWVREHGEPEMRERLEADVLDPAEAREAMIAAAFAGANMYQKMSYSELDHDYDNCNNCEQDNRCASETTFDFYLSKEQFAESKSAQEAILARWPDAKIGEYLHRIYCESCDAELLRREFRVTRNYCGIELTARLDQKPFVS
jgi:hypothetical protein